MSSNILQKREMLFTVKTRFSPQTQPVKETALEKIIEQNLLLSDSKNGLTLDDIQKQGILSLASGNNVIGSSGLKTSINRLIAKERILINRYGGKEHYKLSENALNELDHLTHETESRFNLVVSKLFKNTAKPLDYVPPFLRCLSIAFSELGERYVRIIKGDVKSDELLSGRLLPSAIDRVKKEFKSIDDQVFNKAIIDFFQDSNPEYDAIKWNMAQNFYIAKVIGLEPNSRILSHELFSNSELYLDTNVIVSALEEEHEHHKSFKELSKACQKVSIRLKVCQISIDELRGFIANQRELIEKVANQIPNGTAPKVRGIFFRMYYQRLKSQGIVNFNELFSSFDAPSEDLKKVFNIDVEDDHWFDGAKNEIDTINLAKILSKRYFELRGRPKNEWAAIDDAILIRWLEKKRRDSGGNIGLVTLDTSLPGSLEHDETKPFIITLDALLQWVSPIAVQFDDEEDFASVFSEAIKYQLLPKDTFFELRDFLMFAEMQMSCKELPAEDVEECIRYIKFNAPKLDPSKAENREKITYEISKFFADPGRKYKQEIERLETSQRDIKDDYEKRLGEALIHIEELEEHNIKIQKDSGERISNLERKFSEQEERFEKTRIEQENTVITERLKGSAQFRLFFILPIFVLYEGWIMYLCYSFGDGNNLFQKIINAWPLIASGPILVILLSWFFIGKERLMALGWPFTKLLKD